MKAIKYKADIYKTFVSSKSYHYKVYADKVVVESGCVPTIQEALATVD